MLIFPPVNSQIKSCFKQWVAKHLRFLIDINRFLESRGEPFLASCHMEENNKTTQTKACPFGPVMDLPPRL